MVFFFFFVSASTNFRISKQFEKHIICEFIQRQVGKTFHAWISNILVMSELVDFFSGRCDIFSTDKLSMGHNLDGHILDRQFLDQTFFRLCSKMGHFLDAYIFD